MTSYVLSDPHFTHANIIKFTRADGLPVRDFKSVEEMDSYMVERWNDTVASNDTVYMLGDIVLNRRALPVLERLNGHKVLIKGNHDIFKLKDYLPYFDDIRAYKIFHDHNVIMSHIPIHPGELGGRFKYNIHGHLHERNVLHGGTQDPRYINVCVEQIEYTPVSLEAIFCRLLP